MVMRCVFAVIAFYHRNSNAVSCKNMLCVSTERERDGERCCLKAW